MNIKDCVKNLFDENEDSIIEAASCRMSHDEETPISVRQYRAITDALTDVAIEILDADYNAVHKASASVAREFVDNNPC